MRLMTLYGRVCTNDKWHIRLLSKFLHVWTPLLKCGDKCALAIKRCCVKGRRDASEDLQLGWTRAHEKDWGVKDRRGDMCVGVFHWRNVNLKSHADEFPIFIHGSCGLPQQGSPLPLLLISSDYIVTAQSEISLFTSWLNWSLSVSGSCLHCKVDS